MIGASAMLDAFADWFFSLGTRYGVDPVIFGLIYIGAIPFFSVFVGRLVFNLRAGRPIVLPALGAGVSFVSAYLYLFVTGRDLPVWVYLILGAMIIYGVLSTARHVRRRVVEG
jgi:hypothetical protein